jgi:hypothetical protein
MPRRNRALSIMVMPIAILLFFNGWSLYWIGPKKEPRRHKVKLRGQKELAFIVPIPEKQHVITHVFPSMYAVTKRADENT